MPSDGLSVKVGGNQTITAFRRIQEKDDLGRTPDRQKKDQRESEQEKDSKEDSSEWIQVSDQQVEQAIEGFSLESNDHRHGLVAEASGSGPGLKVLLKDASGGIIRQMTGEEFVKLRQEVAVGSKRPGKILDQKL